MDIKEFQVQINELNEAVNFYIDEKKTRAESKKVRLLLGNLKGQIADFRRLLVAEDKK